MDDGDARRDWHDQRGVVWAAGAAAVALIVLLVWAVVRTADSSVPGTGPVDTFDTSAATSSVRKTPSSITRYPTPSVQISTGDGPPPPSGEAPTADEPTFGPPPSTSIFNPYATTTTQNGGAV